MDFQLARLEEELGLGGIVGIGAIGGRLGCCEEGEVWRVGEVFRESCGESLVPASGRSEGWLLQALAWGLGGRVVPFPELGPWEEDRALRKP